MELANDTIAKEDHTLPINWEKSGIMLASGLANSDDTLMTEERKFGDKTQNAPFSSMPDLSSCTQKTYSSSCNSNTQNTGGTGGPSSRFNRRSGTGTPPAGGALNRHLTQKEYDQQLDEFRRENFNLRIRIHFLLQQLSEFKDATSQDLVKKILTLETEADNLRKELETKKQMLHEALSVIQQSQNLRNQDTVPSNLKGSGDGKNITTERKSNIDYNYVRQLQANFSKLEHENQRLKTELNSRPVKITPRSAESDSDPSLLLENEKLIMRLKARVVQLEQQIAEQRTAFNEQLRDFEEKFLLKESEMVPQFQSTGFMTVSALDLAEDANNNADLQAEIKAKNSKIEELENQLAAANSEKQNVDQELNRLKVDMQKERENGLKHEKIIHGLLKKVARENSHVIDAQASHVTNAGAMLFAENRSPTISRRKFCKNSRSSVTAAARMSLSYNLDNISALTDPSMVNFTALCFSDENFDRGETAAENRQKLESDLDLLLNEYEMLKKRYNDILLSNEQFNERICKVSDSLLHLANKLGGEAGKLLLSFSNDLSKVRDEFVETSIIFNQTENEKEIEKLRTDLTELSNKCFEMENFLIEKNKLIEEFAKVDVEQKSLLTVRQKEVVDLTRFNEKLERYAKIMKVKYRKLQAMYREAMSREENLRIKLKFDVLDNDIEENSNNNNNDIPLKNGDGAGGDANKFAREMERLIDRAKIDAAVRQLEENNKILAARVEEHEKLDENDRLQATKYKALKKRGKKAQK